MRTNCYYPAVTQENLKSISLTEPVPPADAKDLFDVTETRERYAELYAEFEALARKQIEKTLTPQEIFENAVHSFDSLLQTVKDQVTLVQSSITQNPKSWEKTKKGYYCHPSYHNHVTIEYDTEFDQDYFWEREINKRFLEIGCWRGSLYFTSELLKEDDTRYSFQVRQLTSNPNVWRCTTFEIERCEIEWSHQNSVQVEATSGLYPDQAYNYLKLPPFTKNSFGFYVQKPKEETV